MATAPTQSQLRALRKKDPILAKAMRKLDPFPGFPARPRRTHFHTLSRIIIYQQLAGAAASTIHNRVRGLSPSPRRFLTPEEMLAVPEGDLRGAGLSQSKTKAIRDLAGKVVRGELKLRGLSRLSDEEVVSRLTAVWGLGEWSAQMFLLFHLGRLDVFAPGDLGLREGIRILDGLEERPGPTQAAERAQVWSPLRSVASWYLWRLTDG